MVIVRFILLFASALGFLVSMYFSLATYNIIREDLIESMPVCNLHGEKQRIVDTKYGRVLWLPNSLYGLLYYTGIFGVGVYGWLQQPPVIEYGLLTGSAGVVGFSLFLFWALLKKLRTPCRLCITSHILNIIIFVLLSIRWILVHQDF